MRFFVFFIKSHTVCNELFLYCHKCYRSNASIGVCFVCFNRLSTSCFYMECHFPIWPMLAKLPATRRSGPIWPWCSGTLCPPGIRDLIGMATASQALHILHKDVSHHCPSPNLSILFKWKRTHNQVEQCLPLSFCQIFKCWLVKLVHTCLFLNPESHASVTKSSGWLLLTDRLRKLLVDVNAQYFF